MEVWLVELGGCGDVCIAGDTAAQEEGEFAFPGLRELPGFGPSHTANKWRAGSSIQRVCCSISAGSPVVVVARGQSWVWYS